MGDFLAINGRGESRSAHAYGGFALNIDAIYWYLAFATVEDARKWYDISAMEFS